MAGPNNGALEAQYTCKCLNIRILPISPHSSTPDIPREPDFTQVFVGEEGITIAHPPLTVRTRTRGVPLAASSRFSRYTTVTCLSCDSLVYRVHQIYSTDVEGKDGPVLPTESWVERDILNSLNGWIEVHRDCLTSDDIEQAKSSMSYSSSFGLLLPALSPSTALGSFVERPPSPSSISSPPPPPKFFSDIQPVFLPPPYTPSHPVFEYLASFAAKESQAIRDSAENFMTEQMRLKSAEIQRTDDHLRRRVNALWKVFKDNLGHVQPEKVQTSPRRPSSGSRERLRTNGYRPSPPAPPNAIRDFNPTREVRGRSFSPPAPRVSALSQSLASSSFHHRKARTTAISPPPAGDRSPSHDSSHSDSYTLGSSTIVVPNSVDATNILKMRRNIGEGIDTATSYRYFLTLEDDMARLRGRRASDQSRPIPDQIQPNSSHPTDGKNSGNDMTAKQPSGSQINAEKSPTKSDGQPQEGQVSPSRGREKSKGNRKVTFNVNPAVVTIKREVNAEKEEEEALADQEDKDLIFDLEDLEADGSGSPGPSQSVLLLVEQPSAPARPRKHRPRDVDNLATAFAGLRPASLPAPSHIRPPRSQHGSDLSSPSMILSLPRPTPSSKTEGHGSGASEGSSGLRSQETLNGNANSDSRETYRIAADAPNNSGQEPGKRASRLFVQESTIMEEGEDDGGETDASGFAVPQLVPRRLARESSDMFVGSLAIPIKQGKQKETLSLASYQPRTLAAQSTQTRSTSPTAHKQQSSQAIRKSMYAERDRSRSLDPGPLDFQADDDDEEQDEDGVEADETQVDTSSAGGRGRKAALKILKARSEVPEAGMWRSLAS